MSLQALINAGASLHLGDAIGNCFRNRSVHFASAFIKSPSISICLSLLGLEFVGCDWNFLRLAQLASQRVKGARLERIHSRRLLIYDRADLFRLHPQEKLKDQHFSLSLRKLRQRFS